MRGTWSCIPFPGPGLILCPVSISHLAAIGIMVSCPSSPHSSRLRYIPVYHGLKASD